MKKLSGFLLIALILGGCTPVPVAPPTPLPAPVKSSDPVVKKNIPKAETTPDGTALAMTPAAYKEYLARRISEVNSTKVYPGRPQALLRSVIVAKYAIDANGELLRSEIVRSNRDRDTEATTLHSIKNTAPFPKPGPALLRNGRVEITETWLFNNDGRFQLRTIAQAQVGIE